MANKYSYQKIKNSIDSFWKKNKFSPTIRDIMEINGISSTSVTTYILRNKIDGVRFARHGKVIPLWVDELFGS